VSVSRTAVMVVGLSPDQLPLAALLEAGIDIEVAALRDFETAKGELATRVPDVLIAALRLGSFNGLHLVLRAKTDNPALGAIVVADLDDPVLRRDAEELGAMFIVGAVTVEHLQLAMRINAAGSA
jgi:DNA-binding NarL/FixJ family response regulator